MVDVDDPNTWNELDDTAIWEKYGALGRMRNETRMKVARKKYDDEKSAFEAEHKKKEPEASSNLSRKSHRLLLDGKIWTTTRYGRRYDFMVLIERIAFEFA